MTLRSCNAVVSDDVLEVICEYLGASCTSGVMCTSNEWREFLMNRMEFIVHEKSQSLRDVFTPIRGEECTLCICNQFKTAQEQLQTMPAVYQTLLASHFGRISHCPFEVKKGAVSVQIVKKMVDFRSMGSFPVRYCAIRRRWKCDDRSKAPLNPS
uniref:Uncharacterized protein n=1 Tax=Eutreptiella gymnastica TaxID=73025 RepID=A0A7S1I1T4_9EUGL